MKTDDGKSQNQQRQGEQDHMNGQKIGEFVSRVVSDLNATANCALVFIWRANWDSIRQCMQNNKNGTVTSQELATLTDTNERFVRDWLAQQVCSGDITYDPTYFQIHVTKRTRFCFGR